MIIIIPTSFASDLDDTITSIDNTSIQAIDITSNEDNNIENYYNINKIDNNCNIDNNSNNCLKDNLNIKSEKTNQVIDIKENINGENANEKTKLLKDNKNVLKDSGTAYFDANAATDGSGTESSPYKTLNGRLSGYSTYIFAPGTYTISSAPYSFLSSSDMTLKGSNPVTTIIEFTGTGTFLNTSSVLNFIGITLKNIHIESTGLLNASNTIFDGGIAPVEAEGSYYYGNSYGGAIKKSASGGLFDGIFGSSSKGLILDNCTFRNNHAAYGGAIYISNDTANITNTIFENNYAENGGGSISAVNGANLTIINCKFNNDFSKYDGAGGVYLFNYSKAIIKDSQFNNNSAGLGAGVTSLRSTAIISNSNFTNNNVSYAGGAVFGMYGNLSIENSNFDSNKARYGGAVYGDNLTSLILRNGIYSNNQATGIGGAILSFVNKNSQITNPSYRDNKAEKYPDLYESEYLDIFIGNENYDMLIYNSSYTGSLPSKFDLRNINAVTGLNDQANSGNCWAYSSIAVLESCAMKASGNAYNFSEGNLKNLAQIFSDFGWGYETNEGGFYQMPIGYLTSWLGPVNSTDDPADDWDVIAPVLDSAVHVQNILYLGRTSYTDNNKIKEAIMKYGAIATEIYISNSYLQSNGNYYCNKDMDRNHAICVIGWDDSRSISGAPGNGAWIVKNSYGSKWGDGGYGYVSYYDHTLFRLNDQSHNSFTIIFNDTIRFNRNYQYDYAGFTDYFVTGHDTIYYANEFTAEYDDNLAAFSTYFNKTSNWEAKVYLNGILKDTLSGISDGGYYTFNLNNQIPLQKGDKFRIEIKLQSDNQANFPISEATQYGSTRKHFKPGVSFFSFDGNNWTDLYNYSFSYGDGQSAGSHIYYGQVACIKAFTTSLPQDPASTRIEIEKIDKTGIIASLKNSEGIINNGNLIFTINNQSQSISITDGHAILNRTFTPGNYSIKIAYNGSESYNPTSTELIYELKKENLNLNLESSNIKFGEKLNVKINLTDDYGNIVEIPVTVNIFNDNNISIFNNTISNGNGNLSVSSLAVGVYKIVAYASDLYYNDINRTKTIIVENINTKIDPNIEIVANNIAPGENLTIKVIFNCENAMINLKINNGSYVSLIQNGSCSFNIPNLNEGSYNYTISFNGNNQYNSVSINGNIIVSNNQSENRKIDTILVIDELVKYYGSSKELIIHLIDENNDSVANKRLNIEINSTVDSNKNKAYNQFSDENGTVSISINQDIGEYDVFVKFEGDEKYNSSYNHSKISIKDKFEVTNLTENKGKISPIYVYAHDINGNPLKNVRIRFKVADGWYSRKTNDEGVAKFNIYLNPGDYIILSINTLTNETRESSVHIIENKESNSLITSIFKEDSKVFDKSKSIISSDDLKLNGLSLIKQINKDKINRNSLNLFKHIKSYDEDMKNNILKLDQYLKIDNCILKANKNIINYSNEQNGFIFIKNAKFIFNCLLINNRLNLAEIFNLNL